MKTINMLYIVIAFVVVVGGGFYFVNRPAKQALLEVNDENCKVENVLKIEDSEARQVFLKKCQTFAAMKKPLLPEVNTENCQPENVVKIEDMTARQDFREKCQAAADAQARSGYLKL
jgi:entry exclusion lipoprotein TrbK